MSTICQSVLHTACIQICKLNFNLKTRISKGGVFSYKKKCTDKTWKIRNRLKNLSYNCNLDNSRTVPWTASVKQDAGSDRKWGHQLIELWKSIANLYETKYSITEEKYWLYPIVNAGQITNLKQTNNIEAMQGTLIYGKRPGICSGWGFTWKALAIWAWLKY